MADLKPVIATTVIHRSIKPGVLGDKSKGISSTPPEVQIIKPGARFIPKDADELAELTKADAIKAVDEPAATMAEAEAEAAADETAGRRPSGKRGSKKASTDDDNLV